MYWYHSTESALLKGLCISFDILLSVDSGDSVTCAFDTMDQYDFKGLKDVLLIGLSPIWMI